jgi:hypothetical protein
MECLVCHQKIKSGEQIFFGSQMRCCGFGEYDCSYSGALDELVGALHLSCLKSPIAVIPEPAEESELVVQRSNALGMFDL